MLVEFIEEPLARYQYYRWDNYFNKKKKCTCEIRGPRVVEWKTGIYRYNFTKYSNNVSMVEYHCLSLEFSVTHLFPYTINKQQGDRLHCNKEL